MIGDRSMPAIIAGESEPPDNWEVVRLGEVAEVRFSSVDKLTHASEQPVRLCNYIDVYNNDYITPDLQFMRASATQAEIDRFRLQIGDVIVTKDSETPDDIGVPAVVDYVAVDLICGYHLGLIRPKLDHVDPTFLGRQLAQPRLAFYFGQQANGSTRYGLPLAALKKASLWLPSIREQNAVGAIVRRMDEAIAGMEAVITKLKGVRAGLLQDLLSRGLDENGEPRNPLARPDEFRSDGLCTVPRSWRIMPLRKCLREDPQNGVYKPARQIGTGVLLVGQTSITDGRSLDLSKARRASVSPVELDRFGLNTGDILVSRVFATISGVGLPTLVPNLAEPTVFESNMMRLRVDKSEVDPLLLFEILRTQRVRTAISASAQLSNQASINQPSLNRIGIAVPLPNEQKVIVERITTHDSLMLRSMEELDKLQNLRTALLSDLVNGRIQVPECLSTEETHA